MDSNDIGNRFKFHPATETTVPLYANISNECWILADWLNNHTPDCREKSLAITKLEEVMFWANAAIARKGNS